MIKPWLAFIFPSLLFYSVRAEEPRWDLLHQSDYDVIMEIVEVKWFNNSHMRNFKSRLVFYNRTQKVLNASIDLLKDITKVARVEVQAFRFASNEYRFYPITFGFNACHEFACNSFGFKDLLKKTSNISQCPVRKGSYYVGNLSPDTSRWAPFIPRGRYKIEVKLWEEDSFIFELDVYCEIKDKPLIV